MPHAGEKPKISIIVLNFNGLSYLKQTIPALLALKYPNKEVVVFDNGSTDGSVGFLKNNPAIKLIESSRNLGYSAGKNRAVEHSSGEFVLLIDNDILINDAGILEKMLENYSAETAFLQVPLLDAGKDKTGFYGIYFSVYGVNLHKTQVEIDKILHSKHHLIEIAGATGGCMFFERNKWFEIEGFDEAQSFNLDDIDIGPRAIIYGYKNFLFTKSYFTHLGIVHKRSSRLYANRFRLIFSGHARSMVKNYKTLNLIKRFPLFFIHQFFKAFKYTLLRKNIFVLFAFFDSFFRFCRNLKGTLRERKIIQRKRTVKTDAFLKIDIPKF